MVNRPLIYTSSSAYPFMTHNLRTTRLWATSLWCGHSPGLRFYSLYVIGPSASLCLCLRRNQMLCQILPPPSMDSHLENHHLLKSRQRMASKQALRQLYIAVWENYWHTSHKVLLSPESVSHSTAALSFTAPTVKFWSYKCLPSFFHFQDFISVEHLASLLWQCHFY